LRDTKPSMPPQLQNRRADNWRLQLAIADLAGGGVGGVGARRQADHTATAGDLAKAVSHLPRSHPDREPTGARLQAHVVRRRIRKIPTPYIPPSFIRQSVRRPIAMRVSRIFDPSDLRQRPVSSDGCRIDGRSCGFSDPSDSDGSRRISDGKETAGCPTAIRVSDTMTDKSRGNIGMCVSWPPIPTEATVSNAYAIPVDRITVGRRLRKLNPPRSPS
jgi:hypothetical protein